MKKIESLVAAPDEPKEPPKESETAAGKVYESFSIGSNRVVHDSAWVASMYLKNALKLADICDQIESIGNEFDHARNITADNGDPAFECDELFKPLAKTMAVALNYYKEYRAEANGETIE